MKKILSFIIAIMCISFVSNNVYALELDDELYYNDNGIAMTETQVNNLKSLQFTEKQIARMTKEEFDMNKDLHGELAISDAKYYKTTYIPKITSTFSLNNNEKYIILNEEISEEEYNNSNIAPMANCGDGDSCWQTTYKRLETSIIKVGSQYRFRSDIDWNQPPATRSNDVLATAFPSTDISTVSTSKYARYDWYMTRYDDEIGWYDDSGSTTYNSGHANWRIGPGGYSIIIGLKADEISKNGEHIEKVWNQSAYMYYDIQKATNTTIYVLDAYGSYQHAQKEVSLSSLANLGFDFSASNIIKFIQSGIEEKYDNMRKTHAQLTGISW